MGRLYNAVMHEYKRQAIIERLAEKKIVRTKCGKDLEECTYKELKHELVLASFRDANIQSSEI